MPLIPIVDVAKLKKVTDEPKFGTVVDNNDPDKLGKIKVLIPGIFEGSAEQLPWVRRKNDTAFCGDDAELFDVPAVGSVVEVKWNYDEDTPMYSGVPNSKKHTSNLFTQNYPFEGGIRFGQCYIKFDKESNLITISNGKCFFQCDPTGKMSMTASGNLDFYAKGDINFNAINANFSGNVNVAGDLYCDKGANGAINLTRSAMVQGGLIRTIQ